MAILAEKEEKGKRHASAKCNVDKAIAKKYREYSLHEMLNMTPSGLTGVTSKQEAFLAKLHIKSVKDLAHWKFASTANSIVEMAKFETEVEEGNEEEEVIKEAEVISKEE